jgi:SAM-dependent methyltransferase
VTFDVTADAYGRFMGRFSEPLAAQFVELAGLCAGQRALDVGCGPGALTARLVERLGVDAVAGVDPSAAFVAAARARFPGLDVREAKAEALPFADDSFDVVAGFNAFFFAVDMVVALRESGRVAKPGASVVIQVWGRHERCDLEAMKAVIRPFLPPRPPDAPPDPDLSARGILEGISSAAGLTPTSTFDLSWHTSSPARGSSAGRWSLRRGLRSSSGRRRRMQSGARSSRRLLRAGYPRGASGSRTGSTS